MAEENGRRTRGTGHVYKPKDCRYWYIRYYDPVPHRTRTGRLTHRVTESSKSTSKEVAEALLRKRLSAIDRGEPSGARPSKVTFGDLVKLIEADYAINKRKSVKRMRLAVAHLRESFDGVSAPSITPQRFRGYIQKRQGEGAAPSTIMKERAALSRMFSLAISDGRLAYKPKLPTVKVSNVRQEILTDADIPAILDKLPADIRDAVHFGALTGWRIRSEVLPLTWDRVDVSEGVIRWEVGATKNEAGRVLAYGGLPELAELIERRAAERKGPYVFHRKGAPILTRRFYRQWHEAVRCAAIGEGTEEKPDRPHLMEREGPDGEKIRPIPHDLRRAAVVRFERNGIARSVATSITGHKTESIYRRYAITREAEQREALGRLGGLVSDVSGRAERGER